MTQDNNINLRMIRKIIIVVGILITITASLLFSLAFTIHKNFESYKPYATYTRLMFIASGCDKFEEHNGTWPDSLAQLKIGHPEFNDPWDKDTWGREIMLVPYKISIGYGEVISYGRDGKPGGTGLDRDLIIRFPTEANTDWNKQQGADLPMPLQRHSNQ